MTLPSLASPVRSHVAAFGFTLVAALVAAFSMATDAHEHGHDHAAAPGSASAPFVATTAKPFAALMDDAMAVMDDGMRRAPMNGTPEHDFNTMMIPHHQGAVDMAKALLLTTQDVELRNLAQQIVTDQQIEIRLMQVWLERHASTTGSSTPTSERPAP